MNDMKATFKHFPHTRPQGGVALLITLLLMGVLLGISMSLLNVTLKQYQLAGIAYASEAAFQAANAGMECALYYDHKEPGLFDVPGTEGDEQNDPPRIECMNGGTETAENSDNMPGYGPHPGYDGNEDGMAQNGEEQYFEFDWGDPSSPNCVRMSIYKFHTTDLASTPVTVDGEQMKTTGAPCPQNSQCTVIQSRGYNVACDQINTGLRVVEREYTVVY